MNWQWSDRGREGAAFQRLGAIVGLAVWLGGLGCGKGGGGGPPVAPASVETIKVGTSPVEDRLSAVGTVQANESVELKAEVPGRIKAIHFTEGQHVQAGALLFEMDADKEAAQLAQAQADLELARQNAARAKTLSGTRAISQQEIDQINSQVVLKEAVREFQSERLKELRVFAPFEGVLGPRTVSLGQFVNVGTTLATLTDDRQVKVVYRVPERHAAQLKVGQKAAVRVAAYGDRVFDATVDLINPQVDPATRSIEVRAVAPNPGGLLKPGMFARTETITATRPSAVVIPERAVVPSLTGFGVYLVRSNRALLTPVQLGMRLPGQVEVQQGLGVGEEIIVGGLQKVADGTSVAATPASSLTNGLSAGAPPNGQL